jgi:hypothetical protein
MNKIVLIIILIALVILLITGYVYFKSKNKSLTVNDNNIIPNNNELENSNFQTTTFGDFSLKTSYDLPNSIPDESKNGNDYTPKSYSYLIFKNIFGKYPKYNNDIINAVYNNPSIKLPDLTIKKIGKTYNQTELSMDIALLELKNSYNIVNKNLPGLTEVGREVLTEKLNNAINLSVNLYDAIRQILIKNLKTYISSNTKCKWTPFKGNMPDIENEINPTVTYGTDFDSLLPQATTLLQIQTANAMEHDIVASRPEAINLCKWKKDLYYNLLLFRLPKYTENIIKLKEINNQLKQYGVNISTDSNNLLNGTNLINYGIG